MTAAMGQARSLRDGGRGVNWLQRRVRPEQVREFSLLLLIVVAVLVFGSLIDSYYTSRTFNRIASSVAIITIVAVGPDAGRADAQHRPLGRLHRRLHRLFRRHAARRQQRPAAARCGLHRGGARRGSWARSTACWSPGAACPRSSSRSARWRSTAASSSTCSGAKTVTTDSLPAWLVDLPRLNLILHRRSRHPRAVHARARHRRRLPVRDQLPHLRPALLRDRLQPRRGRADRPAGAAHRLHRLRPLRRARRASPASCSSRASATSRSRPAAGWSCRSSRPSSSAASTSSAARARSSARCSARS